MLKREDFYAINKQTLHSFYTPEPGKETTLYIYPHLNAIITRVPSKKVKQYIYTEYSIKASLPKRLLVWFYARLCLNSLGILAARKIKLPAQIPSHTLIYPCNRKFRIFDFGQNTVSVITKAGFPQNSIQNEISFRTQCAPSDFILPINTHTSNTYSERIIDGIPLARLEDNAEEIKQTALQMWHAYSANHQKIVTAPQYADLLQTEIDSLMEEIRNCKPSAHIASASRVVTKYLDVLRNTTNDITLTQSHGDLQAGNIWVEKQTKQIYIIDWESVAQRSIWYDRAVLNNDIRKPHCFETFAKSNDILNIVVILEEIIYRMQELCQLPSDYGVDDFNIFINKLENF